MKAILEDIPAIKGASSFYARRIVVPAFEFKWHFHPEFELTYILRGKGYRIVGNSHEDFSAGDFVLLGSNLPHTWWGKLDDDEPSEAIVIQFSTEFMQPFLALHESRQIKTLLENSSKGLRLTASDALIEKIMGLNQIQGLDSVLTLLAILQEISQQKATQIASNTYQNVLSKKFETRINKVCTHLQIHCCEPIRLKEVADLVCMSESNFCKFFKKATSTTFSDYINDLRINEACNLLLFSDYSISEIAHASGFESLSYFNRVFLKKKQTTPSLFRKN